MVIERYIPLLYHLRIAKGGSTTAAGRAVAAGTLRNCYSDAAGRTGLGGGSRERRPALRKGERGASTAGRTARAAPGPAPSPPSAAGTRRRPRPAHFRIWRGRVRDDSPASRGPRKCNLNLFGARIPREKVTRTARGSSPGRAGRPRLLPPPPAAPQPRAELR